jgi:hypothetical protein
MNTRVIIAVVLLAIVGYGIMEAIPLIAGPSLTIASPVNGASIPDGFMTVSGNAARISSLSLNGAPLLMDENGDFSRLIVLPHGSAILTFTATDRFGRTITREESVYAP